MFNASEEINVIARHRLALSLAGLLAGFAASGQLTALSAQNSRTAEQNVPRVMVGTLKSTDRKLGTDAAEAIRSRLAQEVPTKQLWVVPKTDVNNALEGSGFSTTEALSANDAKELARVLRADFYVDGNATKTSSGVRLDTRLVLTRDNSLVQPLPPAEAGSANGAAAQVAKEVRAAMKQLDAENKCVAAFRAQKYPEAISAARAGIQAYPRSTIARACIANAYSAMKAPSDSILAISKEILAIDPQNGTALKLAAPAYMAKGDTASAIDAYTMLVSTDPGNTRIVEPVVSAIAASGQAARAVPIINKAVTENPGDPRLLDLQFRLLLAAKSWKDAIRAGEEMVRTDTALADTLYFTRLAAAYTADSQPAKAAEAVARGIAKFPNNADMYLLQSQTLRAAGQTQQAAAAAQKALALNPKVPRGWVLVAQAQSEMNQPDSAIASLQKAQAAGDSAAFLGQYALSLGNQFFKKASSSKSRDDFANAVKFLTFADKLAPSPQAKFLLGASAFSVGQSLAQDAQKGKSCALARQAQESFTTAEINLPAGGAAFPEPTKQYLGYLGQISPAVNQMVKAYCK